MAQSARITWNGAAISEAVREAAADGVTIAAEHLLGEARPLVPIEEATLERSGAVVVDRDALAAAVVFDTEYAVRQHEDMTYRHDQGRQAKYLEEPRERERDTMLELFAARVRRAMQ
ncbi:hypothetical protein [Dactylosporangium sp. NPDC000521]|uniref:hypothetical protein n=1 Tax=Dactylosporangium sp. NPDC000521 TaxID=3363975 RepID=UPI0036AF0EA6